LVRSKVLENCEDTTKDGGFYMRAFSLKIKQREIQLSYRHGMLCPHRPKDKINFFNWEST